MLDNLEKSAATMFPKKNRDKKLKKVGEQEKTVVEERHLFLEQYDELQGRVLGVLAGYNKKVADFFRKHQNLFAGEKADRNYLSLREERGRIARSLYEEIQNSLIISDYEKKQLKRDIDFFYAFHNLFEANFFELDQNSAKACGISKEKQKKLSKNNVFNISGAEAQQYIAMAIISNKSLKMKEVMDIGKEIQALYPIRKDDRDILVNSRNENPLDEIERGIYGLLAAYYYYQKKGHRVLFPNPCLDAKRGVDLLLINLKKIIRFKKEDDFERVDFGKVKEYADIPASIRKFITLVQIKCHISEEKKSSEISFEEEELRDYLEKINQGKWERFYKDRFGSFDSIDSRGPLKKRKEWEAAKDFNEIERPSEIGIMDFKFPTDFNARYIDFRLEEAHEIVSLRGEIDMDALEIEKKELRGHETFHGV